MSVMSRWKEGTPSMIDRDKFQLESDRIFEDIGIAKAPMFYVNAETLQGPFMESQSPD